MQPEQKFKRWIIEKLLSGAHVQTIETSTGSGVPDINACWCGKEFWIEAKVATAAGKVLLRPFQWAWMQRRIKARGVVLVLAQADDDRVWAWRANEITTFPSYVGPRRTTFMDRLMTF